MMEPYQEYQKYLFGGELGTIVPELKRYQKDIDDFFAQQELFAATDDFRELQKQLLQCEKTLAETHKENQTGTKINQPNKLIEQIVHGQKTPFLSDSKIKQILEKHPPLNLQALCLKNKALQDLSPREKLSLTRFTESNDWKKSYKDILTKTDKSDFEAEFPICMEVDTAYLEEFVDVRTMKPWMVSHAKETGVIVLFTGSTPSCKTPHLLQLAVFLHYVFEVHNFSLAIQNTHPSLTGLTIEAVLKNRAPHFPFLTDGNAHDETLYWRQAITELCHLTELNYDFLESVGSQLIVTDGDVCSLHLVDMLWEMNHIYTNQKPIYHLQQEVWCQLLMNLVESLKDTQAFNLLVTQSLADDNQIFFTRVLYHKQKEAIVTIV